LFEREFEETSCAEKRCSPDTFHNRKSFDPAPGEHHSSRAAYFFDPSPLVKTNRTALLIDLMIIADSNQPTQLNSSQKNVRSAWAADPYSFYWYSPTANPGTSTHHQAESSASFLAIRSDGRPTLRPPDRSLLPTNVAAVV
jgi:hypothetical protein